MIYVITYRDTSQNEIRKDYSKSLKHFFSSVRNMSKLINEVYSIGGFGEDSIKFGYSYNNEALKIKPIEFANRFHIAVDEDLTSKVSSFDDFKDMKKLVAILQITDSNSCEPKLSVLDETEPIVVSLQGKINKYDQEALEKRKQGKSIPGLNSLIVRTIFATSVKDGNLFLHAESVIDTKEKILYVFASDKDGTGKTTMALDFVYKGCQWFSNNLRFKISKESSFAYPQMYPFSRGLMLVRKKPFEKFKLSRKTTSEKLGLTKVDIDDLPIGPDYQLMAFESHPYKVDLNEFKMVK